VNADRSVDATGPGTDQVTGLADPTFGSPPRRREALAWCSGRRVGGGVMRWYHYVAYFFGGAFLANALPHLGNGIAGHAFQSPFASPPGEGLSSSTVNVLWGLFNVAVGYLLVCRVGRFDLRKTQHVLILGLGILAMSVMLARTFGRFHGGL
jgi:hypothetical protein